MAALVVICGTLLVALGVRVFCARAVGVPFRPSEPDPWPNGVQEDDDVRWRWVEG